MIILENVVYDAVELYCIIVIGVSVTSWPAVNDINEVDGVIGTAVTY